MGFGRHCIWAIHRKAERPRAPKRVRLFDRPNSSCSASFVAMMQTTDLREGNDLASGWRVYWARLRAILVERQMCSGVVMILKIRWQHTAQVMSIEYDDVIEALPADRANEPLNVSVLPGWSERNRPIAYSWTPVIYRTPFIQTRAHIFASAGEIVRFGRWGFKVPALTASPVAKMLKAKLSPDLLCQTF